MPTDARAPVSQEAVLRSFLDSFHYWRARSSQPKDDDSRESKRQVPDSDHDAEPDTPEPVDCDLMEAAVPNGANKQGLPRALAVMLRPRPKLLPRTDAEKKGAARCTVRQDWLRIPQYMHRVNLVRQAEALEALAAARGSSAPVYPTASMLAVPTFPIPTKLKSRSTKSVVAPHQKRKRATDDDDDNEVDEAHDAKRRRVGSDASSLSRAVDRPVVGNPARGCLTGATASTNLKFTTSAASRVPRTIRVPATPINCPAPRRSASVVGNAKVEKVLLSVPEFGSSGHVPLNRDRTPTPPPEPPRRRRMIPPAPKAASAVTTGGPDASPKPSSSAGKSTPPPTPTNKPLGRTMLSRQSTSLFGAHVATPKVSAGESMPTPPPTNKPLGRTMLSRQSTSLFGADVATPSSAPLLPSTSPSAGPSQASKPTPTNKPLGRTMLSRQPTSLFGADVATPSASGSESMSTPTPTPTPTNRPLRRTMLRRQPTSLFGADVAAPRASAPSPPSSPPLSLSPPPSQASMPISTPYSAPWEKTVHPAPATARGQGKKAYREILPAPAPEPEPVPQVSTRDEIRQRWIEVFNEEPPADLVGDTEAEASMGAQMDDAASA